MAPVIRSEIPGMGIIEGNFSPQEARDLELLLNAGALPVPLERGLGPTMGAVMADLHRDHGVDLRLGVGVVRVEGGDHVEAVRLTDGTVLETDVVVVGIGVTPNTDWLEGSGVPVDDGVVCDAT